MTIGTDDVSLGVAMSSQKSFRNISTIWILLLTLVGCGGGGGGGDGFAPTPTPDAEVGGIWVGTVSIAGQGVFELIGLVTEDGRGHFVQEDGVQYWGTVTSSGNSITVTFNGATPIGTGFPDGSFSGSGSITGTISERNSITATSTFTTTNGTTTTGAVSLQYDSLYERNSSLSTIAGNYTNAIAPGSDSVNISSSGVLFGQVPSSSCVFNGQVTIIDSAYNAYDIRYTYSSCTGQEAILNGSTFSGIGTLDNTVFPETAIAGLQGTVAGTPFAVVFIYERT